MIHTHNWLIDSPAGPVSTGRCACGAEKEFHNYGEDARRIRRGSTTQVGWNERGFQRQRVVQRDYSTNPEFTSHNRDGWRD